MIGLNIYISFLFETEFSFGHRARQNLGSPMRKERSGTED